MLKAVGKDIYTNGYGEDLKVVFEELVQSIRNTYGEESKRTDGLQEGSIWSDPDKFMYSLSVGDRSLSAMWADKSYAQAMMRKVSDLIASAAKEREVSDTTGMNALILSQLRFPEKLPNNVGSIIVEAKAKSPTEGYLVLDYYFSN